ncbi:YSIRK-type signal peptide-containing protein [Staphylococcus sp. IVB6233]|uniref:GA-like domain-containing protein n=1 Tax=Staphylococcus sp. IVB6233 TaxID=2989769 RepID=UPI0021CF6904|nr:YSIRK-type signal peptide-containing protein [Staphylococcus sp. IVB6233]UXR76470.1 YSIRK-type signal peptide-containing protein [Staphylococcus sp. IVB6233]
MNNKNNFLSNRLNKYSIRKVSFGTASLLIGATLLFGVNNDAQAAEETKANTVSEGQTGEGEPAVAEEAATEVSEALVNEETVQAEPSEVEATDVSEQEEVATDESETTDVVEEETTQEVSEETATEKQTETEKETTTEETETASETQEEKSPAEAIKQEIAEASETVTEVKQPDHYQEANEATSTEEVVTAGETVQSNETVETPDVPATRYDAAVALSEELEKNKPYATTSGTAFRSAFRSVPTTRAADTYTGKIIDYPGDLVQKLNDPSIAVAPGNINFSPKFVDGKSKSYAFLVNSNGTITKKQLATNSSGTVVAYRGTYVELSNNAPEAYVYLSNVGIAGGHIVDAIAKVSIIPSKDGDAANTRYFFMSGRDYLSLASRKGGGAKVDLTFVEHKEQSEFDNLYNTVQLSQTTKDALLQQLDSIKGAETSVSGLLNVYDLDDYSATKSKDSRKSITFERNQVDKLYVSNETRQQSSALMELTEDKVTLTSGSGNFGGTYDNNKRVTVTFENQSQLNYTITGSGASGPAFHPDGLLLLQVPPYHVEDVSTTTGQDDQFVIHQTVPARDVRKTNTLPTNVTLGVQAPEGVKLTLKENTTSLFTADKSASTDNNLTIVPGKNGNKDLNLLKNATYYNKIYDLPITASHGLTLADIENNTSKWQALQQYYDKDEEVLKVPLTYTFDNSAQSWDNLTTDKTVAVMNVSDDIKDAFRRIDEAAAAVEEAKKADEAAKAALAEVNENGLITPTEVEKLTAAQQNAIAKKTAATNIVNQLPAAYQGDMPTTLAGLTGIDVPAVTDENENGVADNVDTLVDDAKKAVEAAKDADQAAKTELAKANGNNLITPEEEAKLKDLAQKAEEAKAAAEAAVAKLPEEPQSVKEQKDTMTGELSSLDGITVPEVNDEDGNGVADDIDAQQVKEAQAAVEAAKAADQAAKKALEDFNKDGLITPTDKKELERLQEEAAAKKAEATAKVEALPEGQKGELPTELEKLDGISVPEVNDEDGNNVADDVDTLVDEAKKAVEAAKEADKVAKAALVEANENGLITPEEEAKLTDLAQKAEEAKAAAEAAVAKLPEAPQSVKEQKDTMTGELSSLDGITVPKINDKDGNNVADDVDALVDEAKKAVEAAKEADQAAKDALDKANENSLITPTEKAELEKLQQVAADKKAAAEEKVNDLPEDQKGELPTELDKLEGITIPEVTDEDENGVADTTDAQRAEAETAVEAAKAADKAAKDALAKANEDGLITPTDKKELERLQEEAAAKKAAAEEKVNDLPEDQKGELPTELDKLEGITVPEVTDEDGNGVADDVDKQREAAEAAVAEAKAADKAAKDALAKANEDSLITPTEKAELEKLQQAAADKKAEATAKVEALPEDQKGDLPTELDKLDGITVPEVTDEDENGVADDVDKQREAAEAAVEEAKAADQAAKDALAEANEDGLITPTDKKELERLQEEAAAKKAAAEEKVNDLPEDQKGELPTELDKLEGITIPEVTDEDENGVADTTDAQRAEAETAVEAAKAADKAAKDALAKANEDGLITPTDKKELERLQEEAAAKKAAAEEKVNDLPEDQKGELPTELDKLEGITVPEVTDEDENGVADDVDKQREAAKAAVEEAKAADQAAKDALAEANENNLITPAEKEELERLQEEATAKKAAAEEKVNDLPEDQKGDLPSELDKLEGITVPEVTDEDGNGVADDVDKQREAAEAAVAEAKAADKAAKDALAKANEDSLITPTEKAELEKLQQAAADKKAEATAKVEALPEDQKGDLPTELDKLDGITVPEVTDEDENGVADDVDKQREAAEAAVEEAKAADQAAKDALAEANEDGLITPTDKKELERLQEEAAAKKAAAEEKVNDLPEDQKGELPTELDKLEGITVPEVTDEDENGVADDVDKQREAAKAAVEEAKAADQAAKDALAEANENNLITPAEKEELERLQEEATAKKAAAEEKVNDLPEDQKGELPTELDKLEGITVPEVTDEDENGVADDVDKQREAAEAAVEEAKAADKATKDALTEANEDGLITPTEKAELERLQEEAVAKKAEAAEKVEALPEDQKGELPSELDKLEGITIPEVTDEDENGVADTTDAQRAEAETAVEAAKAADKAAKDALAKANEDGLITPTDKKELERLQEEAAAKKAAAEEKVNDLPEDQKGELPTELDKLDGITVPEVNDEDGNGVADDVDKQREAAEAAVAEAKAADKATKDALTEANEDGLITPTEKAQLERLQEEAVAKKAEAAEKVEALPEDQKGELPSELDKLEGITIPEVTDEDENGVADTTDAQRAEAETAVEAAKAADKAAKDALAKANEDGLITPTDKKELERLQEEAAAKKAAAEEKVNDLPEDQKGELPTELDKLDGITVPEVNDEDGNGVADDVDKQREAAEAAVAEAKAADKAAKDALAKANEDSLITPTEKAELEKLQQAAADKKAEATAKVEALPEDQKGDLPTELDKLEGITVPEVTDEDGNGVADDVDKQREAAEAAVAEAKAADKAAKDALAKANEDGLITPTDKKELERLQEEAAAKKAAAEEKVNDLPEDQKGELPTELDKLDGITVPEVNDEDGNGVADDVDKQREAAEAAVAEAKAADKAAKDALAKANEDSLITPTEKAELEKLQQAAADKKAEATAKVEALPEDQKGDLPTELDKLEGITVPEVTDEDENGVADDVDKQREAAKAAVEEAKAADKAAKDALAKANEDGLITPTDKKELERLQEEAAAKKAAAEEKVNDLPEDQKGELPTELDKLDGITVPEVNDEDGNGVADDVDKQREAAEAAVAEAKATDKAAKDALTEANEDGLITPTEKAELERLQEEAVAKKAEAAEKVEALPEDQKGELPSELDKLEGITIPEVTDEDENGVADTTDAQRAEAEIAVEAAKAADKAAKDALAKTNEDGLITPTDKKELERLQEEAAAKKAAAEEKVNDLPEDQKGELPTELDKLEGITVPEVNDEDGNGVTDDVDKQREAAEAAVAEAKAADKAAKDALAKANEDSLITPTEKAELEKLQQAAADKKAEATAKVEALPEDQKGDLPTELDKLEGITVPEVTDEDENGVADDVDKQREAAKAAVEEAKAADKAAKDALAKANEDGLITPTDKKELERLQEEAAAKKAAAEEKVNDLPEDQKGELPTELDKLDGITVPEVNDEDGNGVADDVDKQREAAEAAVAEAKAADKATKDALTEANEDGLITPTEKAQLERLQEEAVAKKAEATEKVEALPEDQKGELPSELDKLEGITIPEVTDEDENGVADDVDAQRAEAEAAVADAKAADKAAKDALTEANEDGLITPTEKAELEKLQQAAADKKAEAAAKVEALPEDQKGDLPSELDKLEGITVPEVTDEDENGVADTTDAQRTDAEKAVEEAKQADQAAKDGLAKANEDGLITPTEKAELEKLQQAAADKKAEAAAKVEALPEDQKGELPSELDKLEGITVPEVTDEDENGVADDVDAQRAEAETAVEAAKAADKAAKDALTEANEDGLITPTEKAELERLQEAAAEKKAEATAKVEALPEDQKGDLPSELDKLEGITVPEVTDEDENGVADDVDAQRVEAEAAVADAKAADKAAKDALAKANEDSLITPTEKAELEKLQQDAAEKKAEAAEKVEALPEDQKGELPSELDKLEGIIVPEVTDEDENGVADTTDAQRAEAEAAVADAKAADKAAKDALTEANEDGLITPTEKAELEKLQQAAADKKAEAEAKVEALPEDQKGDLPSELDKLDGIIIPEVNDSDENGVADDTDAQRVDAEKAVEEAKQADQAAKSALAKANEDGLITPTEKAELEKLQQAAAEKKAEAEAKVEALPEGQKGDLPAELDKLDGITVPEVNDSDENGVADDTDAQRTDAEKAVEAAKAADQAAKDALAKAKEDGLITPTEKAELEKLQQAAIDKKVEATAKVEALLENQKGDLPSELEKLDGITVPEVNDADENGIADGTDAQRVDAEKAVEAAKKADQAAKDALAEVNKDGLITPTEKAELEKLQEAAADKKAEATAKVDALPEDQKGDLPSELDKLDGIIIPEVNDSDENGVADTTDAQRADAENAVEAAKQADHAAKDALAKAQADGIITPDEKAELERLQEEAAAKKAEATAKVDALPEDQKGDLPEELDKLTGIVVPEVTDKNDGDQSDKDTNTEGQQEKPGVSPTKPTEKGNDSIPVDGETIKEEAPSHKDSEGKKQTLHELPETGQDSQQPITLFGGLITALGGLLFFRRRKDEKESK